MKVIKVGDTYYIAQNIIKVKQNKSENTIGVFTTSGDADWYDCPNIREADNLMKDIVASIEVGE